MPIIMTKKISKLGMPFLSNAGIMEVLNIPADRKKKKIGNFAKEKILEKFKEKIISSK